MRGALVGIGITAAIFAALIGANVVVELAMGHPPFGMLNWSVSGKLVTFSGLFTLALGAAVGYASDYVRRREGR